MRIEEKPIRKRPSIRFENIPEGGVFRFIKTGAIGIKIASDRLSPNVFVASSDCNYRTTERGDLEVDYMPEAYLVIPEVG